MIAKKKFIFKLFFIIMTVILFIAVLFICAKTSYEKINKIVYIDKIYKNIFVNDIDVGLLTFDEAKNKLNEKLNIENFKNVIIFFDEKNNREYRLNFKDFEAKYNIDKACKKAFDYARNGKVLSRYEKIIKLKKNKLNIKIDYGYEIDHVKKKLSEIEKLSLVEPVNAKLIKINNSFIIIREKEGHRLDLEEILPEVENYLKNKSSGRVNLIFKEIKPQYKEEDLRNIKDILGSFSTSFSLSGENKNRSINIINAVNKINNTLVYPGEIFSLSNSLKPLNYDGGYLKAKSIVNGKIIDEFAGGICQVSTTLYNAALFSELEIIERKNHSRKVSYIDYGFDATLANNYIDLKIKNSLEKAILIESFIIKNNIFINIYGQDKRNKERKVSFVNELIDTIQAPAEQIIKDKTLEKDQRLIMTRAQPGYVYKVYKIINNNNSIEKKLINTSIYSPVRAVVRVGC